MIVQMQIKQIEVENSKIFLAFKQIAEGLIFI